MHWYNQTNRQQRTTTNLVPVEDTHVVSEAELVTVAL